MAIQPLRRSSGWRACMRTDARCPGLLDLNQLDPGAGVWQRPLHLAHLLLCSKSFGFLSIFSSYEPISPICPELEDKPPPLSSGMPADSLSTSALSEAGFGSRVPWGKCL